MADLVGDREADAVILPLGFAAVDNHARSGGTVSLGIETPKFMILF
jgi:hypothetical protein